MNGQLVQVCRPSNSSWELIALVVTLRQEVAGLRAEVERLKRENLEFRQQAGYWKSRHRDALQRTTELEQKVEQLEGEKRQLQADLFGKSTENTTRSDRSNHLDDPQDDGITPTCRSARRSSNCLPSDVYVPMAAGPLFPTVTATIRSRSRSRWVPIAG